MKCLAASNSGARKRDDEYDVRFAIGVPVMTAVMTGRLSAAGPVRPPRSGTGIPAECRDGDVHLLNGIPQLRAAAHAALMAWLRQGQEFPCKPEELRESGWFSCLSRG
jgi:hypothetical protein